MVIPVFGEIGKYGGLIRRGYIGSNLSCNYGRPIRTGLLRFSTDGFSLVPAVAESVERNDDGTVWTAKLREGMRWSDGAPFTADDFVFHHKMVLDDQDHTHSARVDTAGREEWRSGEGGRLHGRVQIRRHQLRLRESLAFSGRRLRQNQKA